MHRKTHYTSGAYNLTLRFLGVHKLILDLAGLLNFYNYLANFRHKTTTFMQKPHKFHII